MYSSLRPAARRLLSIGSNANSIIARSRTLTTQSTAFATRPAALSGTSSILRIQQRWNSNEAAKNSEQEAKAVDGTTILEAASMKAAAEQTSTVTEAEVDSERVAVGEEEQPQSETEGAAPVFINRPRFNDAAASSPRQRNFEAAPSPTVYVGNLFFDVTADDLKARMEAFGTPLKVNIVHDARGLSKGFGYVTFDSVEAAQRAIEEMNQQVYEGRRIVVQFTASRQFSREPFKPKHKPTRYLYIGNLSFDLTDRELNEIFKSVRNLIEVRVAVDRNTGKPRGFAHADFLDMASAQAAMEILNTKAPHGRRLYVDFCESQKRRGMDRRNDNQQKEAGAQSDEAVN